MRARLEGCEVVHGNLQLLFLPAANAQANITYDFLNSIAEVTGYVTVRDCLFDELSLRRLSVIRGEQLFAVAGTGQFSLYVRQAPNLRFLLLPSLGEVVAGQIGFFAAPQLCYVREVIRWKDIVNNDTRNVQYDTAGPTNPQICKLLWQCDIHLAPRVDNESFCDSLVSMVIMQ